MVGRLDMDITQATRIYDRLASVLLVPETQDPAEREVNLCAFEEAFCKALSDEGVDPHMLFLNDDAPKT